MTGTAHLDRFVLDRLPAKAAQPEFLLDYPRLRSPDRLNAATELLAGADAHAPAVINDHGVWSFARMRELSDRIAGVLVSTGLIPGGRVLLRGPNGATLFAAWLGVLKAGGVAVTTMPILRAAELSTIIRRAEIGHAVVDSRCLPDLEAAIAEVGTVRTVLPYDGDLGTGELEGRAAAQDPGFDAVGTYRDDPALIAFTSGTTGEPKGCVQLHRDILAVADTFAAAMLQPRSDDRWACSAPIAFTFGLGMLLIFPWRFGGAAITCEEATPASLLATATRHGATILATAPTAYRAFISDVGALDLGALRLCVSAGEHLPASTWSAWRDATGLEIVNGIGATEMMHIFMATPPGRIQPGSTGCAVPGYRVAVLDDAGRPLVAGTGRLAVKGPTGCRYLDDPRQADYVQDGWNVTGDTYRVDEDGCFWYVARSDDMIVSSGYNIAAPEIENALHTHPAVAECAVVGVPCPARGQRVKAYVVTTAAASRLPVAELADELKAHVKRTIAPYKYPRDIEFVDALPKTANGKIRRFALR